MFKSVRIHTKLALALAVPLLVLVAISSFVVVLSVQDARAAEDRAAEIREQVALATSAIGPAGVLSAIQTERNGESTTLLGFGLGSIAVESMEIPPGENPLRYPSDVRMAEFTDHIAASPKVVQDVYAPALQAMKDISRIRADIDAYTGERGSANDLSAAVYADYTEVVNALFDATAQAGLAVDNAALRTGVDIVDLASRNKEAGTDVTRLALLALVPSGDPAGATAQVAAGAAKVDAMDKQLYRLAADGPYKAILDQGYADPEWQKFRAAFINLITGSPAALSDVLGPAGRDAWDASNRMHSALGAQLQADADALQATSDAEAADAVARLRLVIAIAAGVVVFASIVTVIASRSISRPLHHLADEAEDMADSRLPGAVFEILETPTHEDIVVPELEPVPVGGGYEISEVASALNSVQDSATHLAVEQAALRRNIAESFVNLGRRNQNLLTRQLDSITQMEQDEADPEILERLFALDHLATRMRRNAESLLLLGGLEPQRQWSAPIPLLDVIRGALGEVEEYHRIEIRALEPVMVDGGAAADLTHMLAELMENALNFSPPDRLVEIVGRSSATGYNLAIVDNGIGMTADELEVANRRIAGEESFTVAPSKYLGHHVVGVQARRLGVRVTIQNSPAGGVTARINLTKIVTASNELPEARTDAIDVQTVSAADFGRVADEAGADAGDRRGHGSDAVADAELSTSDDHTPVATGPGGDGTGRAEGPSDGGSGDPR